MSLINKQRHVCKCLILKNHSTALKQHNLIKYNGCEQNTEFLEFAYYRSHETCGQSAKDNDKQLKPL